LKNAEAKLTMVREISKARKRCS